MHRLLLATHNQGKIVEYRRLLAELPLAVTYLDAEGISVQVEEAEPTFAGNAIHKARTYAQLSGLWTWADDSGLEVDALGGRPGVHSARYGGLQASDAERVQKLLAELGRFPDRTWTARFHCVVAISMPDGEVRTCAGSVEGLIVDQPRGRYGFGYDPVFYLPEYGATMAELRPEIKNQISHRGRAAAAAKALLAEMLQRDGDPPVENA
jgi:XTP/dITP diphosphohydrolase